MATVLLAPGTTETTSSNITVPAGATWSIGMYVASGALPKDLYRLRVQAVTPGSPNHVLSLSAEFPSALIHGPATYNVYRPAGAIAVGCYYES